MTATRGEFDLETRLRESFGAARDLPAAPRRLAEALETLPDAPIALHGRAAARSTRRTTYGLLGLAAVLLVGAGLALSGGGVLPRPGPTTPPIGTRITYQVVWTDAVPPSADTMTAEVTAIRARIDSTGAVGTTVESAGTDTIVVTFPLGFDADPVRAMIGQTGRVAFVPLGDNQAETGDTLDGTRFPPLFGADGLASAGVDVDQAGRRVLDLMLSPAATRLFADYTASHVGSFLAITLDGRVVSAPQIMSAIPNGDIQISKDMTVGGYGALEAEQLVAVLTSPLPAPLVEISVEADPTAPSASPATAAIDPTPLLAPSTTAASPEPTTGPRTAVDPSPAIDCEAPPAVAGVRIDCHEAVSTVLGLLTSEPRVETVAFRYACVDPTGQGIQYDCATQASGLVTVAFATGEPLVAQVSLADPRPVLVAPLGGDAAARIPLTEAAPTAPCADTLPGATITVRMDPAAATPVWAQNAADQQVPLRVRGGIIAVARPFPLILDSKRHVIAMNGSVIALGDILRVGAGFCVAASDGAVVISGSN